MGESNLNRIHFRRKTTGFLGVIRLMLMLMATVFYIFILSCICLILGVCIKINPTIIMVGFIAIGSIIGTTIQLAKGNYFIRPLNDKEYELLLKKNLIHYTNFLPKGSLERYESDNKIKIEGNSSARANYSMHWKDAKKKYIWFHVSNEGGKEPMINSFFHSHFTEAKPRKYKIVIEPNDIERDLLFIRPYDSCLILKGGYEGNGILEISFKWYNDKIYLWEAIKPMSLNEASLILFVGFRQFAGDLRDLITYLKH